MLIKIKNKPEGYHDKYVSREHFIHKIEDINPLSLKYTRYWKEIKRKCIEGYWHDGKWMPGNLYFYINLCQILLSESETAKHKVVARPFLRDVEWEKGYVYVEARGFSGFKDDDHYTCYEGINDPLIKENRYPKEVFKKDGTLKHFVPARDYLRWVHTRNLGKPLYHNNAKNVIDIECRRIGKSYYGAGAMATHNFLFDGATDYDEYRASIDAGTIVNSETLVGAIDAKYSGDLLSKVKLALDMLVGTQEKFGKKYPCPLGKKTRGSLAPGNFLEAAFEQKTKGKWETLGSRSKIHHRTFKDNPLAGNGTGPNLVLLEEIGFFNNLIDTLGALKDATYNGTSKFGTIWMFGTGGDMAGGSTEASKEVFYNPEQFDCLKFEDIYTQARDGIGLFFPYHYGLNQFRDDEGILNLKEADEFIEHKRETLRNGSSKKAINSEKENNPITPDEAFLVKGSNIFPIDDLSEHLGTIRGSVDGFIKGDVGKMVIDSKGEVKFKIDLKNNIQVCTYRMSRDEDTTGGIQIWEHPEQFEGKTPFGLYLAGTDPYDQDDSTTTSFGSTYIYKAFSPECKTSCDKIVAEYTARPSTAAEHHEQVRRLLLYYNARDLYENERNTMKWHFSTNNSLYLLSEQPDILKATEHSSTNRGYGIHMTDLIKDEIEIYLRDWLNTPRGDGKLNLHTIYSESLLEELIYYNREANFDRVIAAMLVILNKMQNHKRKIEVKRKESGVGEDDFFARSFSKGFFSNDSFKGIS